MNEDDRRSGLKRKRKEMNREKALTVLQEMRLGPGALSWQCPALRCASREPLTGARFRQPAPRPIHACIRSTPILVLAAPTARMQMGNGRALMIEAAGCKVCTYVVNVHVQRQIITLLSSGS
jgi:hypothetical protein